MSVGIAPVSILLARERDRSLDSAPMLDGMVLLNLLPPNSTDVRDVASPIAKGMAPVSMLLLREMDCSIDSAPMLDGMVLLNLLLPK